MTLGVPLAHQAEHQVVKSLMSMLQFVVEHDRIF